VTIKSVAKAIVPRPIWRWLHEWKLRRHVRDFVPTLVERSIAGHRFKLRIADGLAANWYGHDWGGLTEVDFLKRHRLKSGARVFDCGAHQGVVAMVLAREVGPAGKVIAVEAMRHNCEVARENFALNQMANGLVLEAAVAEQNGMLQFSFGMNSSAQPEDGSVQVPAVTIDELSARYGFPDVLFLDVEGSELGALRGATKTLATRPSCFVEVHVNHGLERMGGSSDELIRLLQNLDYQIHVFIENSPVVLPLSDCPPSVLQDRYFLLATSDPPAPPPAHTASTAAPRHP
jgi:FkbM family methyltransferase